MPISTITVKIPGIQGPAGEYTSVTGEDDMVYGVRWDTVNDVVEPGVLVNGSFVASDYQTYPVQEQMQRGLLTGSGVFSPLLASGGAYLDDGSDADLSGDAGQVMVRIPRCYTRKWRSGNYMYYMLSLAPFTGAVVDTAFRDQAYRYCSAFEGTLFQSGSLQTDGGGGAGGAIVRLGQTILCYRRKTMDIRDESHIQGAGREHGGCISSIRQRSRRAVDPVISDTVQELEFSSRAAGIYRGIVMGLFQGRVNRADRWTWE